MLPMLPMHTFTGRIVDFGFGPVAEFQSCLFDENGSRMIRYDRESLVLAESNWRRCNDAQADELLSALMAMDAQGRMKERLA